MASVASGLPFSCHKPGRYLKKFGEYFGICKKRKTGI